MKNLLKILALVLVFAMTAVMFVACDKDNNDDQGGDVPQTPVVTVDANITDASLKNMVSGGNLHVTAVGQSATSTVKQLLKNAGWYITEEAEGAANVKGTYTINNTLAASGINAGDTVIIILGTSGKGLGAAGVSQADELARAQAIVAKEGVKVIAIHTGGKGYRGESSDPIIEAVVPHADVALVVDAGDGQGGNYDNLFTTLCGSKVPLYVFSRASNMVASIKHLVNA